MNSGAILAIHIPMVIIRSKMKCSCLFLLLFFYVTNFAFVVVAQQCVDTTASCSNNNPTNGFFSWDVAKAPPLLSALFPNSTQLQAAWETHPLLSKVYFAQHHQNNNDDGELSTSTNDIPVILHNRSSILSLQSDKESGDPFLSLLTIDDTISIISQPHMRHGVDYKLAKRIVQNGEEHLGMLPNPHYSIDEITKHFHYGGFSVVIDRMHRRWGSIATQARRLEEELNSIKIGVNMYLTPEVVLESETDTDKRSPTRQGFEPHWDWMDVIVIQLAGRKKWSVANEPTVYLSHKDRKRKPTKEELVYYVQSPARFSEFTLCPGDALYIPRGHIHNASTVLFDDLASNGPLDHCPASNAEMAKLLSWHGPSLHLTFGVEQGCEGSLESLLHHALNAYFDDNGASNSVAISAESCILHHSLAEVARRSHPCDFPSFHDGTDRNQHVACNGTASLRRSVPLGLSEKTDTLQYSHLKGAFLLALDIFISSASISMTAEFIHTLQKPPADPELTFCFPGFGHKDVLACPHALMSLTTIEANEFVQRLTDFNKYASASFHTALKQMDKFGSVIRGMNRKQQLVDLERVAQDEYLDII